MVRDLGAGVYPPLHVSGRSMHRVGLSAMAQRVFFSAKIVRSRPMQRRRRSAVHGWMVRDLGVGVYPPLHASGRSMHGVGAESFFLRKDSKEPSSETK